MNASYMRRPDDNSFAVRVQYIDYNGEHLYYRQDTLYSMVMLGANNSLVSFFSGPKDIGSLEVQPLADDAKQTLKERGLIFVALKGRHYKEYEGEVIRQDEKSYGPNAPPPGMGPVSRQQNRTLRRYQVFQF
jgi:hypothetical protein